jgi:ribose transport system permease protein
MTRTGAQLGLSLGRPIRIRVRPEAGLAAVIGALVIAGEIISPGFVSGQQLSTILLLAAPLALLGAGQTLVMITGGIDLSVASTASTAGYLVAVLSLHGTGFAIAVGVGLGVAIGTLNGVGVGVFGVQPLIMTLGIQTITTAVLAVATQSWFTGSPVVPAFVHSLGAHRIGDLVPISLAVWLPIAAVLILGLSRSGFGRALYAIGDNAIACELAGFRVWQVRIAVYAVCGALSAIAGILFVGYTNAADISLSTPYLLPSIAAVVIGGTSIFGGSGGYAGTAFGAIALTLLDSVLTLLDASDAIRQVLYGLIVVALVAAYRRGGSRG